MIPVWYPSFDSFDLSKKQKIVGVHIYSYVGFPSQRGVVQVGTCTVLLRVFGRALMLKGATLNNPVQMRT